MSRNSESAFQINPYTRWVYDHPERLLPEPTPALLAEARERAPQAARLEVDLGCGSGNFLVQRAALCPEGHFVGFELRFKRLVQSARKLERGERANVWLLREPGERFGAYFETGSVDRVYIQFPDPWPRRSQWKKRLIGNTFFQELARVLKPQGEFRLKTDHSGYFLHALGLIHGRPGWKVTQFSNDLHRGLSRLWQSHGDQPRLLEQNVETEFEQLFRSKRKPVHFLVIEKMGDFEGAGNSS